MMPNDWHVLPIGDVIPHEESRSCACLPHLEEYRVIDDTQAATLLQKAREMRASMLKEAA